MISKSDIAVGKLTVKNGLISSDQLEECIDELRELYLTEGDAPSLADLMVQKQLVDPKSIFALVRAHERISRDSEKETFNIKGYELIRKIGKGGLGVVFKARQITMNRLVALKILHKKWITDEEFRKRFLIEARIVGKLSHQNLIKVFDVGREDWKYYFSMEFVDGETVEATLEHLGTIEIEPAIDIIIQILRALKYITSHNIVHCDIKPGNILLTKNNIAKLGDFGFVQTNIEIEPAEEGTVLGTPDYISPEQALGKEVDYRSDLYSLGATFYHMLAGTPPYSGSVSAVMEKHIREEVPPLQEICPDIPPSICEIVSKMMEKSPDKRYQRFEELFEVLEMVKLNLAGKEDELYGRSKSTLYNTIKREKDKNLEQFSKNLELEQQLKKYQLISKFFLVYLIFSLVVIFFLWK